MNGFQRFLLKIVGIFYPTKVYGIENVPTGGVVIVCNHFRFIDPVNLARIFIKDKTFFIAKKELFEKKIFSKILKSYGGIPVDRENPDFNTIMTILKVLKNDDKLVVFPEGTRNKTNTNNLQPLKDGAGIFAVKSKKPILPIMMENKPKLFRKTRVYIGKAFELSNYYGKKLDETVLQEINNVIFNKMNDTLINQGTK